MQQLHLPPLAEGEVYVGAVGDKDGSGHHVILLPGDNNGASWKAQMEWAKSIGGDLPSRIEQAMLWANFREQFKQDLYWSNEVHHRNSGWAWYQYFLYGNQYYFNQDYEFRARAVRRFIPSVI
ncbi:DUF1566 domain-containing protein [Paraburkholderia silvatlantica]|uniref:DUF1566 domain-containing protein n=1 Tax=Paraburkholderia silvatlantica TaxID=321895 RepID=A0ABR6FLR7_9BURK|nr:DUF1566 domain-containing protein [Paraburkholderia silvatlantica]MBB2928353.1 hypothetical protein [Paraburkholderia silvatlantica]PVY34600.1 hypothetical protein C7411_107136 [Paraburkholderia silvatlantica]PXW38815.1 hypothetical protein C7413_107136 [Paraburkholderia silvatlantica]